MYSTLFRELHASRIQLDMNSSEVRASSDGCIGNDVSHTVAPVAILEQQLGSNDQQYFTPFVQTGNGATMFQVPTGWESILGSLSHNQGLTFSNSVASSPLPLGFCLPGYLPENDATRQLAIGSALGVSDQAGGQTASGYPCDGLSGILITPSYEGTLDHPISVIHPLHRPLQPTSVVSHRSHLPETETEMRICGAKVEDNHSGCAADGTERAATAVPSSSSSSLSSSSSSPSSSSSSEVIMSATSSAVAARCTESDVEAPAMKEHEDDEADEARDPDGTNTDSLSPSHRASPQPIAAPSGDHLHEDGSASNGARLQEVLIGSSDEDDDDDDESRSQGAFDRRRGSLGGGGGEAGSGRDMVDGELQFSRVAAGVAADAVRRSQMRRSSIPCISVMSKGRRATAPNIFQRPSAALDYESLKVKLEKLTGPVTEAARKDGPGGSKTVDKSRRTSLAALPQSYSTSGSAGPTSSKFAHQEDSQTIAGPNGSTMTADDSHPLSTKPDGIGTMVIEPDMSQPHPSLTRLQEPTNCFETDDKNLSDDLSSSNSLSSSSSSTSSSSLDKFRLQCVIEHALQYDLRLQEIMKRHELERAYVRKKHRFQWMELEKSLTQKFGEQWKTFVAIQELSSSGGSTSGFNRQEDFTDSRQPIRQNDDVCNAIPNTQTPIETLETITEGQMEDYLEDEITDIESKSYLNSSRCGRFSLLPNDCGRTGSSVVVPDDDLSPRRNSDGNIESLHQRLRPCPGVLGQSDRPKSAQSNGDSNGTRLSHNIANCLAKSSVGILNPNSSRLHRYPKPVNPTDGGQTQHTSFPHPIQTLQNQNIMQASINARFSQLYQQHLLQNLLLANISALPETNPSGQSLDPWARTCEDYSNSIARDVTKGEHGNDVWTMMANRIPDQMASEQTSSRCSQFPAEENLSHLPNEPAVQMNRHSELQELQQIPLSQQPLGYPYSILSQYSPQHTLNAPPRVGWVMTPGIAGLPGFLQNPLLPNERPTYNLQELGPQVLSFPFPWSRTNHPIYSLLGLNDYGEPM